MQHNSEVSLGTSILHRVERMRHTNQVGVNSTWSSPEEHQICTLDCSQSRSAPSLRIRASCVDAVRPHQVACATRQVMNVVENKNETTLEPTTMYRSQIQEFRKKMHLACNQGLSRMFANRLQCVSLELPLGEDGRRQEVGRSPLFSGVLGLTETSELVLGWSVRGLRYRLIFCGGRMEMETIFCVWRSRRRVCCTEFDV